MTQKLENQFDKTVGDFKRTAFIDVIMQKPETTISDLFTMSEKYKLSDLTIAELMGKKVKRRKKAQTDQEAVDVRTADARQAYDDSVLTIVKNADGDYVSASSVRNVVGGTPLQVRKALNRLIESKDISYKGKARATRYSMV